MFLKLPAGNNYATKYLPVSNKRKKAGPLRYPAILLISLEFIRQCRLKHAGSYWVNTIIFMYQVIKFVSNV